MSQSFFARRSFLIVCVVVFLLSFIFAGTRRTLESNTNDVKDWLPQAFDETAEHHWFQEHFPHEQFVLVSWEGCTLEDQRLELFAKKLVPPVKPAAEKGMLTPAPLEASAEQDQTEQQPRLFTSVLTGPRLVRELADRYRETPFSLSEKEALTRLEGSLIRQDPSDPTGETYITCLVVTLSPHAKGKQLRPTLAEIRRIASEECGIKAEDIRLGGPPVDNVAIDIEGERTLFRLAGLSAIVGLGISFLCFRSVRLTAIVFWVAILAAGVGLALVYFTGGTCDAILLSMPSLVYVLAMSGAIHIINYYHDAIREQGLAGATDRAIQHGWYPCTMAAVTTALGLGSLMMSHVIPISKFGFYSALGVLATLGLLFLYLSALLHYFPSRGYAQRHAERQRHAGQAAAPLAAAPLEETFFLRIWRTGGGFIIRHNVAVSLSCLIVMGFFAMGLGRIETCVRLMKLFSPEAEIIQHYQWLEDNLGPLVPMEVVLTIDNQQCKLTFLDRMRLADKIRQVIQEKLPNDVGGVLSAATFAPNIQPGKGSFLRRSAYDAGLTRALEDYRDEFREYLTVDAQRLETEDPTLKQLRIPQKIAERLRAKHLDTLGAMESFGDLAAIDGIGPTQADQVKEAIRTWKSVSNPTLGQLDIPQPIAKVLASKRLRTLRAIQRRGYLGAIQGIGPAGDAVVSDAIRAWKTAHGTELWRISARIWALKDIDYADFVHELRVVVDPLIHPDPGTDPERAQRFRGVDARYTGLVPLVYKTQHELMRGLQTSLAAAFGLIAIVMIIMLKSPSAGLLAMIPNIFPVIIIFGAMGWLRILVDIGTMMTASVALGVAVDDTMHYLAWFRSGLDQNMDRKQAAMLAYERCATAMTQTTLIGGLGLAVFAFSTFTPTQRFGTLMLLLLAVALVGDLIFLPALLTGPLGYFFGKKRRLKRRKRSRSASSSEAGQEAPDTVLVPIEDQPTTLHSRNDPSLRSNRAS